MTAMYKLQQPRKVLESKILKHIKNASDDDKETKYNFLAREYELLFCYLVFLSPRKRFFHIKYV